MTLPLSPRRAVVGALAVALSTVLVGPVVALPAAAQTTTSSTTVAPPSEPTTTTAALAAGWTATVPGPPPPPAVTATPAQIARAHQLAQQIVSQSDTLDELAGTYDTAEQKVAATAALLSQVQARLAAARARADAAQAQVNQADTTLRTVAVDAYVDLAADAPTGARALLATYEEGAAQVDAQSALDKALAQLQQLHRAEQGLRAAEAAIDQEDQQAAAANAAAQSAAAEAQTAAQSASGRQAQLLGVVSQVSGNLAPLVAAAEAAEAQAAYQRFSTSNNLDFSPGATLGAALPQAAAAVQAVMAQVGKPYQWGAAGPASFDCSGLTMWAWAQAGVAIPRVADGQQSWTTPVPISQLAAGDLVYFGRPAHHVGMYVGDGLMVDAPHTGTYVTVESIWWDDLAGFGRVR